MRSNAETGLVGVREAARRLGLSYWTLYAWARVGRVPSVQLGKRRLFAPEDLEDFIAHRRVPPVNNGSDERPSGTTGRLDSTALQRPARLATPEPDGRPPQG
jgi:excisionase family DNA binding protein